MSQNYKDFVLFLVDLGDNDLQAHVEVAPSNATYLSHYSANEFLNLISTRLDENVCENLKLSHDFTLLADESTDNGGRSQLAIFVCLIEKNNTPIEMFLALTTLTESKTSATILEAILKVLENKDISSSNIRFCGLDGNNSMKIAEVCNA